MTQLLLVVIVLTGAALAATDPWQHFYPEYVTEYSCSVQLVGVIHGAVGISTPTWQAEASARRSEAVGPDEIRWAMTIGQFPGDVKGRHGAEKTCSRWMDEAEKRVKGAQKTSGGKP